MRRVGDYPLWIGNARDARDVRAVLNAGIEAVVDLAVDEPPVAVTREIVYLRFPLVDGGDNSPWLLATAVAAVAELLRREVPTLVACGGGMSRSVAIASAAVGRVSPLGPMDDHLRRVSEHGTADLHPMLWEDVKRGFESMNEPKYSPRD